MMALKEEELAKRVLILEKAVKKQIALIEKLEQSIKEKNKIIANAQRPPDTTVTKDTPNNVIQS